MGRHFQVSFRELTCMANPHLCVFTEGGAVQFKWQVLFKTLASGKFSATTIEPYLSSRSQFPVSRFAQALRSTLNRSDSRLRTCEDGEFLLIALMHSLVHSGMFATISIIQQETAFVILVNLVGFFTITSPSWLRKQAL